MEGPATDWLERRSHPDLDPDAERAIRAAGLAWEQPDEADRHLAVARQIAPEHMAVRVAHYRTYFYRHDHARAAEYARLITGDLGEALGLPRDWRSVTAADADFAAPSDDLRFWLFAMQARGYVLMRLGEIDEGRAMMETVAALDTGDVTRTRAVLAVIARSDEAREKETDA